VAPSYHADVT
jgi:pheromone shutdown protein TraB